MPIQILIMTFLCLRQLAIRGQLIPTHYLKSALTETTGQFMILEELDVLRNYWDQWLVEWQHLAHLSLRVSKNVKGK